MRYTIYDKGLYSEFDGIIDQCVEGKTVFYEVILFQHREESTHAVEYQADKMIRLGSAHLENEQLSQLLIQEGLYLGAHLSIFYEEDGTQFEQEIHIRDIVDTIEGAELEQRRSVNSHVGGGFGNRLLINPMLLVGYFMRFPEYKLVFLNIKYYLLKRGFSDQQIETSSTGHYYVKVREGQGNAVKQSDYISYCANTYVIPAGTATRRFSSLSRFEFLQVGKGHLFRLAAPEIAIDAVLKMGSWIKIFTFGTNQNDIEELDIFVTQVYGKKMWRKKLDQKKASDQSQMAKHLEEMCRTMEGIRDNPPKFTPLVNPQYPNRNCEFNIFKLGHDFIGEVFSVIYITASFDKDFNFKSAVLSERTLKDLANVIIREHNDLLPKSIKLGLEIVFKFDREEGIYYSYDKIIAFEAQPLDFSDEKYLEFPPKYF